MCNPPQCFHFNPLSPEYVSKPQFVSLPTVLILFRTPIMGCIMYIFMKLGPYSGKSYTIYRRLRIGQDVVMYEMYYEKII